MSKSKKARDPLGERQLALIQLRELAVGKSKYESFLRSQSEEDLLEASSTTDDSQASLIVWFCRCCFKVIEHSQSSLPNPDEITKTFKEIIKKPLQYSPNTPNFCIECYNFIRGFKQFQNLAIARQKKLKTMLDNYCEDYSEIFYSEVNNVEKETNDYDSTSSPVIYRPNRNTKISSQLEPQMEIKISRQNFELVYDFEEQDFLGRNGASNTTPKWKEFQKCILDVMDQPDGRFLTLGAHDGIRETAIKATLREYGHNQRCEKNYRIRARTDRIFSQDPITFTLKHISTKCYCFEPSSPRKSEQSLKRKRCQDSDEEV